MLEVLHTNIRNESWDWQPDHENVYLTNGKDNLALHYDGDLSLASESRLDHFGIFLRKQEDIDVFLKHIQENNIKNLKKEKTHRDNSISFYVEDPDGNILQILCILR